MELLVDMNLSPRWIGLVNNSGVDAVHWSMVDHAFDFCAGGPFPHIFFTDQGDIL